MQCPFTRRGAAMLNALARSTRGATETETVSANIYHLPRKLQVMHDLTRAGGTLRVALQTRRTAEVDSQTRTELESAAFRALLEHLDKRKDVQNIDMMNLTGFCRNCLSRWYQEAANARGIEMDKDAAREAIYGMPYPEWRDKYQTEAGAEAQARFQKAFAENVGKSDS